MHYVIHDYAGHPFQVHLSRHLALRGHAVDHLYFADNPGPKGWFETRPNDPPSLRFLGITLGTHSNAAGTGAIGVNRIFRELAYGREVARVITQLKPNAVLCGNTPADAQRAIIRTCHKLQIPFIYWLQDIYSVAVSTLLTKKLGALGKLVGKYYEQVDRQQFRASDAVIAISEDFPNLIAQWADHTPVSVINNWAAIDDLPVCDKANDWSRSHNLENDFVYLYSGTLGRKHNPHFLLRLAECCQRNDSVVAVAQGFGVPFLTNQKAQRNLDPLKLLPIQPAKNLAHVLATADVLLATIEAEAGTFAVPSKVLSYLCAGRPILLAASEANLAARTVQQANAGIVVDPADENGFLLAADRLRNNPELRAEMGANGRNYAERTFDLERITDKFEAILAPVERLKAEDLHISKEEMLPAE